MKETNALTKILIKIFDKESNTNKWVHLCYVPETLYEMYRTQLPDHLLGLNTTLSEWIKRDFDVDLDITNNEELETMKGLIKNHYKETYPDIYLEQSTDRQGWLRVWIVRKMREDLGIDGE